MLPPLPEIDDPFRTADWRVSRPDEEGALHTQVLRELCDGARPLHVGAAGTVGVQATLQLVDVLQQQIMLASRADGMAVARALQTKPVWAVAELHSLRVQFALNAPSAARESFGPVGGPGERFLIQAHWPREIYRTSRRQTPRLARGQCCAPIARLHRGEALTTTREFAMLDISEGGGSLLLPRGMAQPAPHSSLRRIEIELDAEHILFTDAVVTHVVPLRRGTHRLGCQWVDMPASAVKMLRHWLAEARERARHLAPA